MGADLFFLPAQQVFGKLGLPAGASSVFFYYTGTTTKAPTYTDAALTQPAPNPAKADVFGRIAPTYLDGTITYRIRIEDISGQEIGEDVDPYVPGTLTGIIFGSTPAVENAELLLCSEYDPTADGAQTPTGINVAAIARQIVTDIINTTIPTIPLMRFVPPNPAADWKPYFDAAVNFVAAFFYEGAIISLPPDVQIPLSYVDPITAHGITFVGGGRIAWPGSGPNDDSAGIKALASDKDMFSWGYGVTYGTRGGGLRGVSIDARLKTGGCIVSTNVAMGCAVEDVWIFNPYNGIYHLGGLDPLLRDVHIEQYRGFGVTAEGTLTKRGDRLTMENVSIAGAANSETDLTAADSALRIIGYWHTVDAYAVRLVKCGLYGITAQSDLTGTNADAKPQFLTFDNLQIDYCKDNLINLREARDVKISHLYANTSITNDIINCAAGASEIMVDNARMDGPRNRIMTFQGKSLKLTNSNMFSWNNGGGGGPAVDLGGAFNDATIMGCTFGRVADETAGGFMAIVSEAGSTGTVIAANNQFLGCGGTPIMLNGSGASITTPNIVVQ